MSEQRNDNESFAGMMVALCVEFGALGGVLLGLLIDNFGLGIPIGLGVGLIAGAVLMASRRERDLDD